MSIVENSKIKLTYEDYVGFPEDGQRHEVIDGDHYVTPSPELYHQSLSGRIFVQLFRQIEEAGQGRVVSAPMDVLLTKVDIVQPDIVVLLKANEIYAAKNIQCAPDLIVEILSPSTSSRDRTLKKSLYERCGVPEYWIVDPENKVLEQRVLSSEGTYELQDEHREAFDCATIDGVHIDLRKVW